MASLFSSHSFAESTRTTLATDEEVYLCFGDSITANGGWIKTLNRARVGHFINAGRSGRKARELTEEFLPVLKKHAEANHLILFIGVNDLPSRDPRPEAQRIEAAMQGVRFAVDHALKRMPPENIHLVTPCGLIPKDMSERNLGKGYQDALPLLLPYAAELKALASERGLKVIDLLGRLGPEHFRDGLHPNAAGEARIAKLVRAHLEPPTSVYWIGDSISINYHESLQAALGEGFRYTRKGGLEEAEENLDVARGANGGDSNRVLAHLKELLEKDLLAADNVVVNCGLHDIKMDPETKTLQVDLQTYRKNLESMVDLVEGSGRKFIWVTTTPVDEAQHQKNNPKFYRMESDLTNYNEVALEVMRARDVPVLDLYSFTRSLGPDLYRDHVHFHKHISERQATFLAEKLSDLRSMSASVPNWADVPRIVESIEEPVIPDRSYRIEDFGAVPEDGSDALPAIKSAIRHANKQGGGRIVIGAGTWFCKGPIHLLSQIELHLERGAVLVFSDNPEDYLPQVLTRWEGTELFNYSPFIYAYQAVNVSITGEGLLDGNVAETFGTWRAQQNPAKKKLRRMGAAQIPVFKRVFGQGDYLRPSMIQFFSCTNVKVEGVSIKDSPFWVVHLVSSYHVTVRGIHVESKILNNDGVDIESSSNVLVEDNHFITGDDSIVIKSGRDQDGWRLGRPSERIVIRNNYMEGHNALAIGSEMSGGVRHVFMENNQLGAVRGALYFKSNEDRGGIVENIHIRNITVEKSAKPLIQFRTDYKGIREGGFPPLFRNISIENVVVEETGKLIEVGGLKERPIQNLSIRNVHAKHSTLSEQSYNEALVIDTRERFVDNLILEDVSLAGMPLTQRK